MRIGFVSTCPPIECGIGTYTQNLRRALKDRSNETFVVSQFGAQGKGVFPVYQPDSATLAASRGKAHFRFVRYAHYTPVSLPPRSSVPVLPSSDLTLLS